MRMTPSTAEDTRRRPPSVGPHAGFFRAELALCLTFCKVAETSFKIDHEESAKEALRCAETGYATVARFLSEAAHFKHLTSDELRQIRTEHEYLGERLGELKRFSAWADQLH
jgi:hypothetical protein